MRAIKLPVFFILLTTVLSVAWYFFDQNDIENEYITEDGLHLRFDGISCEDRPKAEIYLGISPVRLNNYNTCQNVNISLNLYQDEDSLGEIKFVWLADECVSEKAREKSIKVPLEQYISKEDLDNVCKPEAMYGVSLNEYAFVWSQANQTKNRPVSDPLGQQPRIESSIPSKGTDRSSDHEKSRYFTEHGVFLIQQNLSLLTEYSGPFDGKWDPNMDILIRQLLDENLVYFESTRSEAALKLLGIVK